jgi:S1-C subfamily serine protease
MNRPLMRLFLVSAFSLQVMAQTGQSPAKEHSTTKKLAPTKTLSLPDLHDVARRVSVLLSERTPEADGGTRNIGSGVWLAEGILATCWHVVKDAKGTIKISLGTGGVVTYGTSTFEGIFMDYDATVVASDPDADIAILKTERNPFKATGAIIETPTQRIKPQLSVATVNEDIPVAGTPTVLAGYLYKRCRFSEPDGQRCWDRDS